MTSGNSTKAPAKAKPAKIKPEKPYPDFPLTAHAAGQWCKKIKGKIHYFGKWSEPDAALAKYNDQIDAIYAGLNPNDLVVKFDVNAITIDVLVNLFLKSKQDAVDSGEIETPTFDNYQNYCRRILKEFPRIKLVEEIRPPDFRRLRTSLTKPREVKKSGKVIRRAKESVTQKSIETAITHIRAVFNWGAKNYYIKVPLAQLWGTEFNKPGKKAIKRESNGKPAKLASAQDVKTLIQHGNHAFKAMILLGINCGYGNTDISNLAFSNIDFQTDSVELPRQKTGEPRKAMLWPETIAALNTWRDNRPEPADPLNADVVFLTSTGTTFKPDRNTNPITREFTRLKNRSKLNRPGLSFYSLRHTFQTMADNLTLDFVGVKSIMGHVDNSISGNYRHLITDERLQKISDAVRGWLFEEASK